MEEHFSNENPPWYSPYEYKYETTNEIIDEEKKNKKRPCNALGNTLVDKVNLSLGISFSSKYWSKASKSLLVECHREFSLPRSPLHSDWNILALICSSSNLSNTSSRETLISLSFSRFVSSTWNLLTVSCFCIPTWLIAYKLRAANDSSPSL